jgi:hypothetical protein
VLRIVPVDFDEACAFIRQHHRHHRPPRGHKFSLAVADGERVVGVAIVGRPIASLNQDGWTLEVLRVATDGTPNACSKLYRTAWRIAALMGYRRLITYTLPEEGGASLRGAGFRLVGVVPPTTWNRPGAGRPRIDRFPMQAKLKWSLP